MLNYNESSTNPIKCTVLNLKYNIPVPTLTYNTQVGLQITFNSTTVSITQENKLVLMTDDYSANNEYQPLSTKSGNDLYQMILNRKADPVGDTLPIGSVVEWFSNTIPTNWLSCNGQAVSRTEYAELFKILGTKYGSGDGSTTFNLPNIKGKVSVGLNVDDTDFNTLGKTGGEKTHTLTIAELASHTHTFTGNPHTHTYSKSNSTSGSTTLTVNQIPSHSHGIYATANPGTGGIGIRGTFNGKEGTGQSLYDTGGITKVTGGGQGHTHSISLSTTNTESTTQGGTNSNTGSNTAHNNLQPYITSNFIIKACNTAPITGKVENSLTSISTVDALSANQGKILNEKIINNEPVLIKYGIVNNTILKTATSNQQFLDVMGFTNTTQLKNALDKIYNKVPVLFTDISSNLYIIDITPVNLVLNKNTSYPVGYSSFTFRAYSNQTLYEVTIKFTTSNSTVWTYTCTEVGAVIKVEDSLTSSDPKIALSANQGKVLKGLVDKTEEVQISTAKPTNTNIELWIDTTQDSPIVTNVIDSLTSTDTKSALSANQGKILNDNHKAIKLNISGVTTGSATINSSNELNVSVNGRGCIVGQSGNTTTKPWYKFASCTLNAAYSDRNIVFNVYQGYGDASTKAGILIAHFRANSQKIWESGELRWLIKTTSIPVSDFVLAHNTTAPCVVELWCKCPNTYTGYHFEVLAEGDRLSRNIYWTLYNTTSQGSADAPTSGYTQITSTVNKQHIEINTRNTTDTWIPIYKDGELQYTRRVTSTSKTHTNYNTEQDRIPTLGFLTFWNGAYNSSNNSNLTYCLQGEIQAKPTTLYSNASGTKGTVTLSQKATNFAYLDIFYLNNNGVGDSFNRLSVSQNGNYFVLSNIGFYLNSGDSVNGSEIRVSSYKLSGNTITVTGSSYTYIRNKAVNWMDNNNNIYIYKVIGYK